MHVWNTVLTPNMMPPSTGRGSNPKCVASIEDVSGKFAVTAEPDLPFLTSMHPCMYAALQSGCFRHQLSSLHLGQARLLLAPLTTLAVLPPAPVTAVAGGATGVCYCAGRIAAGPAVLGGFAACLRYLLQPGLQQVP
jgi:hypothetical protein